MSASTLPASVAEIAALIPEAPPGVGPSREAIAAAVALIAERFRPERITLFGSRAYGVPTAESDVDLMVVMETALSQAEQAWRIGETVGVAPGVRLHPTVRTPRQVRIGVAEHDFFILDAIRRGVTLFEADGDDGGDIRMGDDSDVLGEAGGPAALKGSTQDWLRKGEGDCRAITHLLEAPEPFFDLACFHAQQCAEKLLKALLQERVRAFPRTHAPTALVERVEPSLPGLALIESDLSWLTTYAVAVRYPGLAAGPIEAERARRIAVEVRRIVRAELGLDEAGG